MDSHGGYDDLHGNFQDFGNPFDMGPGGPGPMGPNSHPMVNTSGTRTPNEPQHNPVQMWQDQHYLGPESGFISGATTTRSSRTGHENDNISEGGFLSGPGSTVGGPESFYDLDSGAPSEVNSLASNHPMLNDPMEHFPLLLNNLKDDDPVIVTESLHIFERCIKPSSFNEQFFVEMINRIELFEALVSLIISATNEISSGNQAQDQGIKMIRISSDILRQLTNGGKADRQQQQHSEYQRMACQNLYHCPNGVAALVLLANMDENRIKYNGIIAIHNLLIKLNYDQQDFNGLRNLIKENQGILCIITLMKAHDNQKFLKILCDSLKFLAKRDNETKRKILEKGGTHRVIEIIKNPQRWPDVLENCLKLIQVLSACQDNKKLLVDNHCFELLSQFLNNPKLSESAALAIRNMSDKSDAIKDIEMVKNHLLSSLTLQVTNKQIRLATFIVEIISNMTIKNIAMKRTFIFPPDNGNNMNGMQILIECLRRLKNHPEYKQIKPKEAMNFFAPLLGSLRQLTGEQENGHKMQALQAFGIGGLESIQSFLLESTPRHCLKGALGIVKNFAMAPQFHEILDKNGFVNQVVQKLFIYWCDELEFRKNPNHAVEGVKIVEILELLIGCLMAFAKQPIFRNRILNQTIIIMLKNILNISPSIQIQKMIITTLLSLTGEPDGIVNKDGTFAVMNFGPCQPIDTLINNHRNAQNNSKEKQIFEMASLIMRRGFDNKNYRPTGQLPPPLPRTAIELHQDAPSQSHGPPINPHGNYPPPMPHHQGHPTPNSGFNAHPYPNMPPAGFDMMSDGPLMGPGGGPPPPHPPNMGPNRGPPPGPPGGHGDWVNDMDMFSGEDQNFNPHPGNNFFGSPM